MLFKCKVPWKTEISQQFTWMPRSTLTDLSLTQKQVPFQVHPEIPFVVSLQVYLQVPLPLVVVADQI